MVYINPVFVGTVFVLGACYLKFVKRNTNLYNQDIMEKAIHAVLPEAVIKTNGFA